MPVQRSVENIKKIMRMLSWYRRFVSDFSSIVAPLTRLTLTCKNIPLQWTTQCGNASKKIKSIIISSLILSCPKFNHLFTLQTDASIVGLGAVLTQFYND